MNEILKLACISMDNSFMQHIIIFDSTDCVIVLSEDIDFDQIYKVKLLPGKLLETQMRGQY